MRGISFKVLIALAVSMAMVTVCALPAEAAWSYNSGVRKIPAGQYFEVKGFIAQDDAGMSYDVTWSYGPDFDVLLMDKANFDIYKSGSNAFSYLPFSSLNVVYGAYDDTGTGGLTTGVEYHLVVDNTDRPVGGASPSGQELGVSFEFGAVNVQSLSDMGLIIVLLVVVIVVVAVLVVLFLLVRSRRKNKMPQQQQYAQQFQQPGMKACRRCGAQVPAEFTFCPQCGNRY